MCTEYLLHHKEAEMHILDQRSVLAEGRSNEMKMSLRPRCCLVKFGSSIGLGNKEGMLPSLYIIHLNDSFIFLCNASIRQDDYYKSAHVMRSLSELLGHALILVENCSNQLNRSERDSSHEWWKRCGNIRLNGIHSESHVRPQVWWQMTSDTFLRGEPP